MASRFPMNIAVFVIQIAGVGSVQHVFFFRGCDLRRIPCDDYPCGSFRCAVISAWGLPKARTPAVTPASNPVASS